MRRSIQMMCVMVLVGMGSIAMATVNIETVTVGNAGNAGDVQSQGTFGAVDYQYNIGKYEVTAGQYTEFLNKVAGVDAYGLYYANMSRTDYGSGISRFGGGVEGNPYTYTIDPAFVNRPVNYVSWGDAARFANWLHNGQPTGAQGPTTTEDGTYYLNGATSSAALLAVSREADGTWAITSEDEWYKAAYHKNDGVTGNYYDFPTSSDTAPGRDMADVSGNNANWIYGHPHAIDSGKYTTLVGEFQESDSPYGTFDQGGNLWEWHEAIIHGSSRGVRGGSFGYDTLSLRASIHGSDSPSGSDVDFGFRVSEVPEPATMTILMLGGIGILRRRRK